jgi:hypothetical protein
MRILLRNMQTGWYYQGPSKWTPDEKEALDFKQIPRAVSVTVEAHMENVEIWLSYDDPQFNLALSVSAPPQIASPRSTGHREDQQRAHRRSNGKQQQ